ncbi:hypothetical protein ACFYON_23560 [Micromonospora sp. NPDC005686]|uniref:hypothetical protein n=1 Tax=unclassified Micromonospora TaxID=2617518 RepID=UPI0033BFAABB
MRAAGRGGRIISVTSVHEHAPGYGSSAYCAAKGRARPAHQGDGAGTGSQDDLGVRSKS